MDTVNTLMEFINEHGLLGALVGIFFVLGLGLWKGAKWAGKKMLGDDGFVPTFVKNSENMTKAVEEGMNNQKECLISIVQITSDHTPILNKIAQKQSDLFNQHAKSDTKSVEGLETIGEMLMEITPQEKMDAVKMIWNRLKTVLNAPTEETRPAVQP